MQNQDDVFHLDVVVGAAPTRWVYLLHGILGQGGNLRTVAKRWISHRDDTGAVLVDLRNHGRSLDLAPPDDLAACAADVERLAAALGRPPAAVLGHSFGGKVALKMAQRAYERGAPLEQLWVLDSTVGSRRAEEIDAHPGSTQAIVKRLESMPATFASREWFTATLAEDGLPPSLIAWLAMQVQRDGEGYRFGPDMARIRDLLKSYFAEDLWPVVEVPQARRVHVVVAGQSTTFRAADRERLRAAELSTGGATKMHLFEDSAHWVHVDAADALDAALSANK